MVNKEILVKKFNEQPHYRRKVLKLCFRELALIRTGNIPEASLYQFNQELIDNGIVVGNTVSKEDLEEILKLA